MITGHGRYIDNVVFFGMFYVAFVCSNIVCGCIIWFDIEVVSVFFGVVVVFMVVELNFGVGLMWGIMYVVVLVLLMWLLVDIDVRFVGDAVVLVIVIS